jgi:sugar/nucleoside kinase (ribokinase family)
MEVVCAGNLVADIFANPIVALPAAGQLGLTEGFLFGAGGCATNVAACLRRLGRAAKVLGKVGNDAFGNLVIEDLKRLGIDASSVSRSRTHPTSGTVIINVIGEERRYIHCIGANADFSFSDIDCLALNGARALYLGGYMAMPRFGAQDLIELFREAKTGLSRPFSTLSSPQASPSFPSKSRRCWLTPMSFCPMMTKLTH